LGTPAVAAWIAGAAFWGFLLLGFATGELSPRQTVLFVLLWLAGFFGLSYAPYGSGLLTGYLAVLDVVLVLLVFRGDVTLT
jgi:hypothetical protein